MTNEHVDRHIDALYGPQERVMVKGSISWSRKKLRLEHRKGNKYFFPAPEVCTNRKEPLADWQRTPVNKTGASSRRTWNSRKPKRVLRNESLNSYLKVGGDLLSRGYAGPSARLGLTSLCGMDKKSGGTPESDEHLFTFQDISNLSTTLTANYFPQASPIDNQEGIPKRKSQNSFKQKKSPTISDWTLI